MRHYAAFLLPGATVGGRSALARNRRQRIERLGAAIGDRSRPRRAPARQRMRALQAAPGGRLRWRDVAVPPPPAPDGAIVHPIAAATCDMDCPLALGATLFALPLHLGHECVAEVLATGERVSTIAPGDRVVVPFQISCGRCGPCRAGQTGSCTGVPPISMYGFGLLGGHWGGAFSDLLAVPYADAMLVALPDGIDPAAAASVADNVCDAYRHIAPHLPAVLQRDPDAEVLIVGSLRARMMFSSSLVLYIGLIARTLGARNVQLADARPAVRAAAERLGIGTLHPRKLRRRAPAPLVVDSSVSGLALALASTAPDGICTSAGTLHRSVRIPALEMYARNVTLHVGRAHVRALIPEVLELMRSGRLAPERIPATVAPLDDAPDVLREHFRGAGVKAILTA